MTWGEELAEVRGMADPVRRAQRLTELMVIYQQRSVELTRLRKLAIEEAHETLGIPFTELARQIGITKGRVSQIRQGGPDPGRIFFGVGPVTFMYPKQTLPEEFRQIDRIKHAGGKLGMVPEIEISLVVTDLLREYDLAVASVDTPLAATELPSGDVFVVVYVGLSALAEVVLDAPTIASLREEHAAQQQIAAQSVSTTKVRGSLLFQRQPQDGRVITVVAGLTNLAPLTATLALKSILPALDIHDLESVCIQLSYEYDRSDGQLSIGDTHAAVGS